MNDLKELLKKAKAVAQPGRKRTRTGQIIEPRRAKKPKCFLGTKLTRNEWEYLGYRSSSIWMYEFNAQLEYQKQVREFEEEFKPKGDNLSELLRKAKAASRRGRPRKERPQLVEGTEQTGYGLKLLELEEKYPVSKYYWNDGPGDPREIPWGSLEDLDKLVNKLIS